MGNPDPMRIRLLPYIKAMWNIFLSAMTHPLMTVVIEIETGDVVERFGVDP